MANEHDKEITKRQSARTDGPRTTREVSRQALVALGPHVEAIQRLTGAAGARETAERSVVAAREAAAQLVRQARTDAAELLRAAETEWKDARVAYRDVFAAAVVTGWSSDQLNALGFDRVLLRPRRLRSSANAHVPSSDES